VPKKSEKRDSPPKLLGDASPSVPLVKKALRENLDDHNEAEKREKGRGEESPSGGSRRPKGAPCSR